MRSIVIFRFFSHLSLLFVYQCITFLPLIFRFSFYTLTPEKCTKRKSFFLRWISDSSSRPQTVTRKHLRDSMCNEKGKAIKEDSPLVRS